MTYVPEEDHGEGARGRTILSADMWIPRERITNVDAVVRASTLRAVSSRDGAETVVQLARLEPHHVVMCRHLHEDWSERVATWEVPDIESTWRRVGFEDRIQPRDANQERAWSALSRANNGVLNLACGGGKTALALKKVAQRGFPAVVLVNNEGLLEQWVDSARNFLGLTDDQIGLVRGTKEQWDRDFVVAMIHTVANRADDLPMEVRCRFGTVLFDECFPAGTRVGAIPIEQLRVGAFVRSYDEQEGGFVVRKILNTMRRPVKALVRVTLTAHTAVVCTPEHPILTLNGWRAAKDLTCADRVLYDIAHAGPTTWVRVVGSEVLEPGRDGRFDGLCPDGYVYNIEVEGTHTYTVAGGLVVHNCHHLSATTFLKTAPLFFGARYGLTATLEREDGLEPAYYAHIGGPFYSDLRGELTARIFFQKTDFALAANAAEITDRAGEFSVGMLHTYLAHLPARNQLIVRMVAEALDSGRKVLALTHSREQPEILKALLEQYRPGGWSIGAVSGDTQGDGRGDTKGRARVRIIRDSDVTFATMGVAREGLDADTLDTVFFLTPFKAWGFFQQGRGRIERSGVQKKEPVVVVLDDLYIPAAHGLCWALRRRIKEHGHTYTDIAPRAAPRPVGPVRSM